MRLTGGSGGGDETELEALSYYSPRQQPRRRRRQQQEAPPPPAPEPVRVPRLRATPCAMRFVPDRSLPPPEYCTPATVEHIAQWADHVDFLNRLNGHYDCSY